MSILLKHPLPESLTLKLNALIESLNSNHALDIVVMNVSSQTSFTDYMIVCSARSSRHMRAITENVISEMKALPLPTIGQRSATDGEWALIDFADFIVNVMLPSARHFYNLEELWQPKHAAQATA